MRNITLGLVLTTCISLLVGCTGNVRETDAKKAAYAAINDWALAQESPYEIIKARVDSLGENRMIVTVFLVVEYPGPNMWILRMPREGRVEVVKIGDDWLAETVNYLESPFEAQIFYNNNKDISGNTPCANEGTITPESRICVTITNKGSFDWQWKQLHWASLEWGGSFSRDVELPAGGTVHLVAPRSSITKQTLGLEDEEEHFWVFLEELD